MRTFVSYADPNRVLRPELYSSVSREQAKTTKYKIAKKTPLSLVITMRLLLPFLACTLAAASDGGFHEGDTCGVKSSDFFNGYFVGDYLVAGAEGCSLADGQTGCYCAPDLTDGQSLGEWKWQCNGVVAFGPADGKTCPSTIPVPKGYEDLEVVVPKQATAVVACNTTVNPTGQAGDEVCPYSDCDTGGDTSAICACVDLAKYDLGEGQQWICMHSTCSCEPKAATSSGTALASATAMLLAATSMVFF